MKVKTADLTGVALDWAVASCEGDGTSYGVTGYSSDWAQGGPIIEREKIDLESIGKHGWIADLWVNDGTASGKAYHCEGTTPLIAAMRCYVFSKMGGEIDLPEEITNEQ